MIEPGSVVGFGLLFVTLCAALSALSAVALRGARRWLERAGPAAERRASALALLAPPALSAAYVAAMVAYSVLAAWLGADHCLDHPDPHPHLCLYHGGAWAELGWALATVSIAAAVLGARVARSLWRHALTRRRLRDLQAHAAPAGTFDGIPVLRVPSKRVFCFVAGRRRPRIFVSDSAWSGLGDGERAAMLAHEAAHVRHGDLAWRPVLVIAALAGWPGSADRALRRWLFASERLCDLCAAATTQPATVAGALVALLRHGAARPIADATGFVSPADEVVSRIEALLADAPDGAHAARGLGALAMALVALAAAVVLAAAKPLHHALETLLGVH